MAFTSGTLTVPYVPAEEPNLGNITGYIKDLAESGLSNNQSYSAFIADGGSIAEGTFNRLYNYVSANIAREPGWASLDPYQIPDSSAYGEMPMGRGGAYSATVEILMRDTTTGEITTTWAGYHSNEPFAPAAAATSLIEDYGDAEAQGRYGVQVLGWGQINMYTTVPWSG